MIKKRETLLKREKVLLPPEIPHRELRILDMMNFWDINSHDSKFFKNIFSINN